MLQTRVFYLFKFIYATCLHLYYDKNLPLFSPLLLLFFKEDKSFILWPERQFLYVRLSW